ncbi:MAG: S1 RNA-binding domain-containing protein, partial [Actinomycetota bacterium]|nr:S1 RNA-binding domain-containing protein [Actinomycetota bacterium]
RDARVTILEVMNAAISTHRSDVAPSAPKIVSFQIPIDKIGEVIGPKGKVINTLQQETGADIGVDDDGVVGTVTIGSKDGEAVLEARRRIELILDPPAAEVGAVYQGRVVNITKFGAFVNILPGRDGLVHISKLGGGRRIDRVEDVVNLGDALEVRVDDIDPQGKVSLSPAGDDAEGGGDDGGSDGGERGDRAPSGRGGAGERPRSRGGERSGGGERNRGERSRGERGRGDRSGSDAEAPSRPGVATVSFEEAFDAEVGRDFGDLGPGTAPAAGNRGGERQGRGRRGGRRG